VVAVLLAGGCTGSPLSPSSVRTPTTGDELLVLQVADGDTFTGRDRDGQKVRVRLLGIDAPEAAAGGTKAGCGADRATASLEGQIRGRTVRVTNDPVADRTDRFGRLLGYVSLGEHDIGLALVEAGMAAAWYPRGEPRPTRHPIYREAERQARAAGIGLWASCPSVGR
jgi:micrococcal nuclease